MRDYWEPIEETRRTAIDDSMKLFEYFRFGNVYSRDYGIYITSVKTGNTPKRDLTFQSVAGRNGDLILDNHRWHNVNITYECAIATNFKNRFNQFKEDMLKQVGYQRITDSITDGVVKCFRLGMVYGSIEPETVRHNLTGRFEITFSCKPQRFLESGEFSEEFTEPSIVSNPGAGTAKPLITVYGSGEGTFTFGGKTVEIKSMEDQLTLDCDTMNAYRKVGDAPAENRNNTIYAPEFPDLPIGSWPISWTGGITKVEVIPRWWTL